MATTKQKKSKHLEESTEKQIFSDGIDQIEQGICKIITGFGQLEQKIHSDTEKDNLETLKATISTLKAEREEQDLIHDNKIKQLADEESQEKKRLLNRFVSQKNEILNENELLMKKIAELCMNTERNESIWREGESQLKQLLANEKIKTQDAHGEIEKWQMKEEMGKSQTKVLEKEIESKRIDLMNTKAYIKRSEDAWRKEQARLRDDIEVEKRNCQRALEASDILQTREKGFEKEMERKRKLIEENFVITNDNLNLKKDLDQKAKDYDKLVATVKEKEHEMISVITSNNKLNKEILTLKESLIETENRLTTLQGTFDKTKERLCKAEEYVAVVRDDKDRQYKEDDYRTGRRNASTMDNRSNSKRHKMTLESTINFGRHRDTFRIARKNQERNELIERAISTEQQVKDKQTENEYLERTIERLKTELKGSKLSLESEQEKTKRLESRTKTSKQVEEDNKELYSTIVKIKEETVDSEKRLRENPGFHTQELILMNRLKELLGSMQTNGNYELNSSNQRIIKSYNINNSQVFFNNKSLIRHGNSEDC